MTSTQTTRARFVRLSKGMRQLSYSLGTTAIVVDQLSDAFRELDKLYPPPRRRYTLPWRAVLLGCCVALLATLRVR